MDSASGNKTQNTTGVITFPSSSVTLSGVWLPTQVGEATIDNFVPKQVYVSADGKTVVCVFPDGDERKATKVGGDTFDVKVAVALCITKKVFGNVKRLNKFCDSKRVKYQENKKNKLPEDDIPF